MNNPKDEYDLLVKIDVLVAKFYDLWNTPGQVSARKFYSLHKRDVGDSAENRMALQKKLRCAEQELLGTGKPMKKSKTTKKFTAQIERYTKISQIGSGGMGNIWLALDNTKQGERVVLKFMQESLENDQEAVERFEREIRQLAYLDDLHVVQIFNVAHVKGKRAIVMQYVKGKDLQEYVESTAAGRIELEEAVGFLLQIATGLQAVAERGITHRDIKPKNIMITGHGSQKIAKIIDFGLAKSHNDATSLTQQGLGSADYAAPEQWQTPSDVNIQADIYGLGCTFYFMIVGKSPYHKIEGIQAKIAAHCSNQPIPSFRDSGVAVNENIENMLQKMCAKEQNKRYETPQTLIQDIKRMQEEQESGADATPLLPASKINRGGACPIETMLTEKKSLFIRTKTLLFLLRFHRMLFLTSGEKLSEQHMEH